MQTVISLMSAGQHAAQAAQPEQKQQQEQEQLQLLLGIRRMGSGEWSEGPRATLLAHPREMSSRRGLPKCQLGPTLTLHLTVFVPPSAWPLLWQPVCLSVCLSGRAAE